MSEEVENKEQDAKVETAERFMSSRGIVAIEVERNEQLYSLHVPHGVPFKDAYEATLEILEGISKLSKQAEEAKKKQSEDETSSDEKKEDNK